MHRTGRVKFASKPMSHQLSSFKPLLSRPAITCSNFIIETLEQGVKYVHI